MPLTVAGILGIEDSERTFVETVGQEAVYDAITEYVAQLNDDLTRASGLFISRTTEKFKFRYFLPGDRKLQRMGGAGNPAERKTGGSYDVALPILQWGDAIGANWIDMAYMSIADVDRQLTDIAAGAQRTLRDEILTALLYNSSWTFADERQGDLIIQPLANNDSVLYPPYPGNASAAVANHYAETGYAATAINDSNNPIKTINDTLNVRYEGQTVDAIALIARNMEAGVEALTDFEPVPDPRIEPSPLADHLVNLPGQIPGRIIGRSNNTWVSVWSHLPSNYAVGVVPDVEAPLQIRVDPAYTNLPRGLTLVKNSDLHPLLKSEWVWRFGLGVCNRLNGFVLECGTGGSYSVPTGYSRA